MGIPLAGGRNDGTDGPDADGGPGVEAVDSEGEVGDVTEGLRAVDHGVYETPEGVGVSLLVENTGTRAFERVEVRVGIDGDTSESVATNGAELGRLAPDDRWRFWVPLGRDAVAAPDATRYTVDVEAV